MNDRCHPAVAGRLAQCVREASRRPTLGDTLALMPERDPFDYSALAPDADFGDDSVSVLGSAHEFVLGDESLSDVDFEAEFAAIAGEGEPPLIPGHDEEQFAQLQSALRSLAGSLVDLQLEADEAWLEALTLDDETGQSALAESPPSAVAFDDITTLEDDW